MTAVADTEPPVLVHCSAGKASTGVTLATVLRLVCLAVEQILADYALTAPAMSGAVGWFVARGGDRATVERLREMLLP